MITVSGLPGSGTSTTAELLAERTGMEILSSGEIFREMAEERDMSLEEFSDLAEEDEEIDKKLDKRTIERAEEGMILEGRLTGHLLNMSDKSAFKVWIEASLDVRVKRIADREEVEDLEQLKKRVIKREKSEKKRYRSYYDIDLLDTSIYDAVLDSEKNRPEEIVDRVMQEVREKDEIYD
ncbi:MAG: cytidylate kinase family protein [Candidatus Thermoplasmatota archaeon]|nr:cytidylate kinase family protein [Candidatus Thermoplasmatota archaeon]